MGTEIVGYVLVASRFIVGSVFLIAGIAKITALTSFRRTVRKYDVLPASFVDPVAVLMPPFEIAVGIAVVLGIGVRASGGLAAIALAAFVLVTGSALVHRRVIDCGCFGPAAPRPITRATVARNLLLLAVASSVALAGSDALALAPDLAIRARMGDLATGDAVAAALVGVLLVFVGLVSSEALRLVDAVHMSEESA